MLRMSVIADSHFEILGVTRSSTKNEIKTAYKDQMKLWHPDHNPNKVEANERTQKINDAYRLLKDYEPPTYHRTSSATARNAPYQQPGKGETKGKGFKLNLKRIVVKSSNIRSIGYDPLMEVLQVEFLDGSIYQYYGVSASNHFEMMHASSKGKYLNRIIKGRCRCERF